MKANPLDMSGDSPDVSIGMPGSTANPYPEGEVVAIPAMNIRLNCQVEVVINRCR